MEATEEGKDPIWRWYGGQLFCEDKELIWRFPLGCRQWQTSRFVPVLILQMYSSNWKAKNINMHKGVFVCTSRSGTKSKRQNACLMYGKFLFQSLAHKYNKDVVSCYCKRPLSGLFLRHPGQEVHKTRITHTPYCTNPSLQSSLSVHFSQTRGTLAVYR